MLARFLIEVSHSPDKIDPARQQMGLVYNSGLKSTSYESLRDLVKVFYHLGTDVTWPIQWSY